MSLLFLIELASVGPPLTFLSPMNDRDRISPYNFKQTGDENNDKFN